MGRARVGTSSPSASSLVISNTPQRPLGWIIMLCSSAEPFVCRNQSAWLMWTCWYSEHPWDISRLKRWSHFWGGKKRPVVKIVYSSGVCLCECWDWTCPESRKSLFFPLPSQVLSDCRSSPYEKVFCPEKKLTWRWWWQAIRPGPAKYSSISAESWDMIAFVFSIFSMSWTSWVLFCFTYMEDGDVGEKLAKTHTCRLWVSCNLLCGLVLCRCKSRALLFTQNVLSDWSPGLQWPLCGSQAHSEKLLECRLLF